MSTPTPKKRKHKDADDASSSKKRKAVSYEDRPISVSIVEDAGKWGPVFTSTPGLQLPSSISFRAYQKTTTKSDSRNASSSTELLLHSASHPRLDYVATESTTGLDRGSKHYVGVYDPATSSLKIVPARQMTIRSSLKAGFVAEQRQKAATDGKAGAMAEEEDGANTAAAKYAAARTALGEAFGNKKTKKALRSAAVNAVVSPAKGRTADGKVVRSEHTDAVLASAQVGQFDMEEDGDGGDDDGELGGADQRKAALSGLVNDAHPRPKPNLNAEVPADVYKLSRVIGRLELDLIEVQDWWELIQNDEDVITHSHFVSSRWWNVARHEDDEKLKALRFLSILLRWIDALETRGSSRKLPNKDKMGQIMEGVNGNLLAKIKAKFAPNGSSLNAWDVQKVMLHACAIAIVLDDFTSDLFALQDDLKLTGREIKSLYKELGCKVDNMSEQEAGQKNFTKQEALAHQIAKLRVPFALPEVRQRRLRR